MYAIVYKIHTAALQGVCGQGRLFVDAALRGI